MSSAYHVDTVCAPSGESTRPGMWRTADPMCCWLLGPCHRRVGPKRRTATGSRPAWRMCFGMFALVRNSRRGSVDLGVQAPVGSGMTFDDGAIWQALLEAASLLGLPSRCPAVMPKRGSAAAARLRGHLPPPRVRRVGDHLLWSNDGGSDTSAAIDDACSRITAAHYGPRKGTCERFGAPVTGLFKDIGGEGTRRHAWTLQGTLSFTP